MNILLTNDDGFDAPGLVAAYQAVCELGKVVVVAPRAERSACSHMITLRSPITVEPRQHDRFGAGFAVDGTPADCVRLAVAELIPE
ncbi:MAG: 5'/3'-nucleotidase SurE, partial [Planctomycetes bacterium]|nr:5'/3'-nucleotidase SurE [Planctomycetota bacterium]